MSNSTTFDSSETLDILSVVPDDQKSETKMHNSNYTISFSENYNGDKGEGAIDGLITETFQNIQDVREELDLERNMKAEIEIFKGEKQVVLSDNAGGMCYEALESSFTNFRHSYKANNYSSETGGFLGIGSAIYLHFADYVFIETRKNGETLKALWHTEDSLIQEPDEDVSEYFEDSQPEIAERFKENRLEHPSGTRIELYGVDEDYIEGKKSLTDTNHIDMILKRWWNEFLLDRTFQIEYQIFERKGEEPNYHNTRGENLEKKSIDHKVIESDDIGTYKGDKGKETDLSKYFERIHLYEFENSRPDAFTDKIVHFNNHKGQTINRYKPHGLNLSSKIMAVVEGKEKAKELESGNHRTYATEGNDNRAKHAKGYVKSRLDQWVSDKVGVGSDSTLSQDQIEALDKGREQFNQIAGKMDGFESISGKNTGKIQTKGSKDYEIPYIHSKTFPESPKDKNYDFNQDARFEVRVMNPEESKVQKKVNVEVKGTIYKKGDRKNPIAGLEPKTKEVPYKKSERFDFEFKTPSDEYDSGKYHIVVEADIKNTSYSHKQTAMFRLNHTKQETEGTEKISGIKDFEYVSKFGEEDIKGSKSGDLVIINGNHKSFEKFKKDREKDSPLVEYGFKVALDVITNNEIRNIVEMSEEDKEDVLDQIVKKEKDRDIAEARFSDQMMNSGSGET